jgi:hypothetical protein
MKLLARGGVCLFSAGWIFPAWLGIRSCLKFWEVDVWPVLNGKPVLHSFSFVQFSQECFAVSLLWLAAVVLYWSWKGSAPATARE